MSVPAPAPVHELPNFDTALGRVLAAAPPPTDAERLPLAAATGRTLREPVVADRDLPPFDRSAMDGYAVRVHEAHDGAILAVSADAPAGAPAVAVGPPGTCVRIATGAPVPSGLDAVVPHERTDRGDPVRFTGPPPAHGDAVHRRGADARAGDELVAAGTRLRPAHVALAATVGLVEPLVARRPAVSILTTGTEVRPPTETVEPHQIRNSNGPMLAALVAEMGAVACGVRHVGDDLDATRDALADAIAEAPLVLTVGGISVGTFDHVAAALDTLGGEIVLRGAAIKPGKPITAVRVPRGSGGTRGTRGMTEATADPSTGPGGAGCAGGVVGATTPAAGDPANNFSLVLCLPGNPVSCLACACLFAWPILARQLGGHAPAWRRLPLVTPVRPDARREAFRPAVRTGDGLSIPPWAGSGDLAHTAPSAGLARLPRGDVALPPGTLVPYLRWPGS